VKKPAYSAALDRVLFRASRLARELGGAQTGTEHLLLALSQERISQTGRILCYQGAEGRLLRCMLLTQPRPARRSGRPGLSGAASRALDAARRSGNSRNRPGGRGFPALPQGRSTVLGTKHCDLARPSASRSICCFLSCVTTPMQRRRCFRNLALTATVYFQKHMTACAPYIRRRTRKDNRN